MPFYTNADQIYSVLQAIFKKMSRMTPDPVDALVKSHMVFRINLTDPDAHITINGRKRPVLIDYGPTNGRADLEIGMTAETLHLIMMDKYSIKQGFSNGELKVRGPIWKAASFAEIFQQGRTYYTQVLEEQGLVGKSAGE